MIAHWEAVLGEIETCWSSDAAPDERRLTPGVRFAAGYGRAVLGAAVAYVRAHKEELVRQVAEEAQAPPEPMALAGD